MGRERGDGLVVVDTDPLKLHYVWIRWSLGQGSEREWDLLREQTRGGFAAGRYALADLFLIADVDEVTLRERRESDATRVRGAVERHALTRDSLQRWYRAIDELEPGRVRFGLPAKGLTPDLLKIGPRRVRSGVALFDALLNALI